SGKQIRIDGLWALAFGNGTTAGDKNALYFTAGPEEESHGLFGSLRATTPAPAPPLIAVGQGMGAAQVRVFNPDGTMKFNFLAYNNRFQDGVHVATGDVDGDGVLDIITGPGPGMPPEIKVFSGVDLHLLADFMAFSKGYRGGLYV